MKKLLFRKIMSALIIFSVLLNGVGCIPKRTTNIANEVQKEQVTIVACSDFQHPKGNEYGKYQVKIILKRIKANGYAEIDGMLCAGDYDYEYEETDEGIFSLKDAVREVYENVDEEKMIFVQGNHDEAYSNGLSRTGDNDTQAYGVYVIHEDEYPGDGGTFKQVEDVALKLETYLQEKVEMNNKKPIFVVSHLPLHYSMRTYNEGASVYAKYIFDVLNKYAEEGQTIIYLYGHNHNTWGYDDYLGGSSVYLTKGDTIYIAQIDKDVASIDKSKEMPNARELNFTYMNAGYVGYSYSANADADKTLTMTVFRIEGEKVTVERYSASGVVDLKAKGVWSAYSSETASTYDADEKYIDKIYESPQVIEKNKERLCFNQDCKRDSGRLKCICIDLKNPLY